MDGGAWRATVHGVTKSQTQLSNSHIHTKLYCSLQKTQQSTKEKEKERITNNLLLPGCEQLFYLKLNKSGAK